ncbi:MAG: hypothetical protein PHH11_00305 [Methylomonas sp.]|nr:hypothetical protein [Methylomonas sp.]
MASAKQISVIALLCLVSSSAWSGRADFCKVKKIYDEKDASAPPRIVYEDCSGEAYLGSIGKDALKASCWAGASELLEGKCALYKEPNSDNATSESLENSDPLSLPAELSE